jgi:hypothetical protein
MLRISFGFNGIILPWSRIPSLITYLMAHVAHQPPDLLLVDWICDREPNSCTGIACHNCTATSSGVVSFRFNLAQHIGKQSSLRATSREIQPACWQLYGSAVSQTELFDEAQCWNDDISPCVEPQRRFAERFGENGMARIVAQSPYALYYNFYLLSIREDDMRRLYYVPRFEDLLFEYPLPHANTAPTSQCHTCNTALVLLAVLLALLAVVPC